MQGVAIQRDWCSFMKNLLPEGKDLGAQGRGDRRRRRSCRHQSVRCPPAQHRPSEPKLNLNSVRLITELS
ncbi:hypothetical protein ABFV05_020037 [Capra hircus]